MVVLTVRHQLAGVSTHMAESNFAQADQGCQWKLLQCSTHKHSLCEKAMEGIDITLVTCRPAHAVVYCTCD